MIWLLIVPLVILWAFLQRHAEGRSRGSLRYQRRKARELDMDIGDMVYRPRGADWNVENAKGRLAKYNLPIAVFLLVSVALLFLPELWRK